MIYVMLSKYDSGPINKKIIEWTRNNLRKNNLKYKLIFCRPYIVDTDFKDIVGFDDNFSKNKESTFFIWNPTVASRNLQYVVDLPNSIVILDSQTQINQKLSVKNPINENLAANYCFYLMYLNEIEISKEWKLAIQSINYLISQYNLVKLLLEKSEKIDVENKDTFENINKQYNKSQFI